MDFVVPIITFLKRMDIQGDGAHFRNLKKLECSIMDSTKLCSGSGTTKKGKKTLLTDKNPLS